MGLSLADIVISISRAQFVRLLVESVLAIFRSQSWTHPQIMGLLAQLIVLNGQVILAIFKGMAMHSYIINYVSE